MNEARGARDLRTAPIRDTLVVQRLGARPGAGGERLWPTGWRTRRARTCSSTRTTPWTGTPGARRRLRGRVRRTARSCSRVGYTACHWCHVMERESFEDEETARMMNEHFVNIKVDREERPDIDSIYMAAVQALTRHGGWPMTVFLTPDGAPFYGGTYFPPIPRAACPPSSSSS